MLKTKILPANALALCLLTFLLTTASCGGNENLSSPILPASTLESFSTNPGLLATTQLQGIWPIERLSEERLISSPFGPREKFSENNRTDFHRGIDLPGELGEPVFAIAPGKIYRVYPEGHPNVPEGGNSVVIEHQFDTPVVFHGQEITRVFSYYNHLQGFSNNTQNFLENEIPANVVAGETIGFLGQSGTTEFNHLHFEIRVGTVCSLEFQINNPQSSCAEAGFDPHVNPIQFLLAPDTTPPETQLTLISPQLIRAEIFTQTLALDIDYAALLFRDQQGSIIKEIRYGINGRVGIDASSIESLDNFDLDSVLVTPLPFTSSTKIYQLNLDFKLPQKTEATQVDLLVSDVWGNFTIITKNL